jgi:hypothetical protein
MVREFKSSPFTRYSFAKQYLDAKRIDILNNGEQILKYQGKPDYQLYKIETKIQVGDYLSDDNVILEIAYEDLMRLGFCLVTLPVGDKKWFPAQRAMYKLMRYQSGMPHYGQIPKKGQGGDHFVLYAPTQKALQLVGPLAHPSGYGPIIKIEEAAPKKKQEPTRNLNKYFQTGGDNGLSMFDEQMQSRIPTLDFGPKFVDIPEIPILFSIETNEVVCIPITGDIPKIGCVGKTGAGKTYSAHGILDHIKWKTNHEIAILNDNSNQSFMWTLPNQSGMQIKYLEKIAETPRALPIIPLYPTTDDIQKQDMLLTDELSQKMSMKFADVVENFDYFFDTKDTWKLGASDKWFRQCKEQIKNATSIDEMEGILVDELGHIKGLKPTINKILSIFRDMMDMNFTDISSGVASTWDFRFNLDEKDATENPVIGLMRTGAIPAIITTNLWSKQYYPHYLRYYMDSIYNKQIARNKPVWMFVDEVGDIYKKGNKKTVAAESFIRACTQGRQRQLGTIYTIQNYSKLDDEVRNNTNYLLSCIYSDSKEINLISKDFDLSAKRKGELSKLRSHELIAMSNDRPLVIYTFDGERREETGVAYKGFSIPCLSEHRRPGAEL